MQRLPGVLEKYGIAWEQAGQAVNQARLDEVAKQLIQDFADLSRAGVDVDVITTKMSASVNAYIQDAIRTGTEIPPAMRPLLQKMIDLGVLTDANGDKITDLEGSGITFAQTMTEGFQSALEITFHPGELSEWERERALYLDSTVGSAVVRELLTAEPACDILPVSR